MKINNILTCTSKSIDSKSREAVFLYLALMMPYEVYCVQFCLPVQEKNSDTETIPVGLQHGVDMLEHVTYTEKQREMGLFSPKRGRLREMHLLFLSVL